MLGNLIAKTSLTFLVKCACMLVNPHNVLGGLDAGHRDKIDDVEVLDQCVFVFFVVLNVLGICLSSNKLFEESCENKGEDCRCKTR